MPELGRPASDASAAPQDQQVGGVGPAILVVDDDGDVRELVATALRRHGYEVLSAGSGREALRVVYERSTTPALLVADIAMPAMSGIELAARLSADRPGIRVILMTGDAESAGLALQRPTLVSGVLLKPFTIDDLLAQVRSTLGEQR